MCSAERDEAAVQDCQRKLPPVKLFKRTGRFIKITPFALISLKLFAACTAGSTAAGGRLAVKSDFNLNCVQSVKHSSNGLTNGQASQSSWIFLHEHESSCLGIPHPAVGGSTMIISFHRGSVLQSFAHYSFAARELSRHNESAAGETTRRDIFPPQCCMSMQCLQIPECYNCIVTFWAASFCSGPRVCVRCSCSALNSRPYRHCSGRDSALILWLQAERELLRRETSRRVSRQDHLLTNMWQNTASILGEHKTYKLAFSLHKHKERCDIICLDANIWNCQVSTDTHDMMMVLLPQNNHPVLCWSHLYWHCFGVLL